MNCPVPLRALVIEQEARLTKNGDLFWQVVLKTRIGNMKAFMWGVSKDVETSSKYPHTGDIIEVSGFKDQLEERKSIVINAFMRITKDDLPPEDKCILETEKADEASLMRAWNYIKDGSFWGNQNHHTFVLYCLSKLDKERLKASPAAALVHHSYAGGLIVHMGEVLELCRACVEAMTVRYNFINRDVVYAAAILHDIGKVMTYDFNDYGMAKQLPCEKTIGHIFYGMELVRNAAADNKVPVDDDFVSELLHCIAAHHGTREWGSIAEPQSLEAGLVSRLDYISSRNGMMEKLLKDAIKSGQPMPDDFIVYGQSYFTSTGIKQYVAEGCG